MLVNVFRFCFQESVRYIVAYYFIRHIFQTVTRRIFHRLGYGYDCATKVELENVLDTGCRPNQIVYANPYKQISHLPSKYLVYLILSRFTVNLTKDSKCEKVGT